jgi:hypothetical protein
MNMLQVLHERAFIAFSQILHIWVTALGWWTALTVSNLQAERRILICIGARDGVRDENCTDDLRPGKDERLGVPAAARRAVMRSGGHMSASLMPSPIRRLSTRGVRRSTNERVRGLTLVYSPLDFDA